MDAERTLFRAVVRGTAFSPFPRFGPDEGKAGSSLYKIIRMKSGGAGKGRIRGAGKGKPSGFGIFLTKTGKKPAEGVKNETLCKLLMCRNLKVKNVENAQNQTRPLHRPDIFSGR